MYILMGLFEDTSFSYLLMYFSQEGNFTYYYCCRWLNWHAITLDSLIHDLPCCICMYILMGLFGDISFSYLLMYFSQQGNFSYYYCCTWLNWHAINLNSLMHDLPCCICMYLLMGLYDNTSFSYLLMYFSQEGNFSYNYFCRWLDWHAINLNSLKHDLPCCICMYILIGLFEDTSFSYLLMYFSQEGKFSYCYCCRW